MLHPSECTPCGIPDEFPRKTAVFKMNGNLTLTSSTTNGHLLLLCYPNYVNASGNTFLLYYTDGTSPLDVTNLPVTANLTASSVSGTNLAAYYSYSRLVGLEIKMTYIGAVETGAGETRIGFTNYATLTTGANVKNTIEDSDFFSGDRAECTYKAIWIPQDNSDLKFRSVGDNGDADKSNSWGVITMCATGLPKNIPVYDLKWTAVIEAILLPTVSDYIPRTVTPIGNTTECLMRLKQIVYEDPSRVCGVIKTGRRLAMATDEELSTGSVSGAMQAVYANPSFSRFGGADTSTANPLTYSGVSSTIRSVGSNPIGYAGSVIGGAVGGTLKNLFS